MEYIPVSIDHAWAKPIPMIVNGTPETVWAKTILDVLSTLDTNQKYTFYMEAGCDLYPQMFLLQAGHRVFETPDNSATTKKRKELGWKKIKGKKGDEQSAKLVEILRIECPEVFVEIAGAIRDVKIYRFLVGRYTYLTRGNAKLKQLWGPKGKLRRRYGPVKQFTKDIADVEREKNKLIKQAKKLVNSLLDKINIKGVSDRTLIQFINFSDPRRFPTRGNMRRYNGFNGKKRRKGDFSRKILSILTPCLVSLKSKTNPLRSFYDETKKWFQDQNLTCADCYHVQRGDDPCNHPQLKRKAKPEDSMCKGQIERKTENRLKQEVHDMIWKALHDDYSVPIITRRAFSEHIKDPELLEQVIEQWDKNSVYLNDTFFVEDVINVDAGDYFK